MSQYPVTPLRTLLDKLFSGDSPYVGFPPEHTTTDIQFIIMLWSWQSRENHISTKASRGRGVRSRWITMAAVGRKHEVRGGGRSEEADHGCE